MSIHNVTIGDNVLPVSFPSTIPIVRQLELLRGLRDEDVACDITNFGGTELQTKMLQGMADVVAAQELGEDAPVGEIVQGLKSSPWLTRTQHAA